MPKINEVTIQGLSGQLQVELDVTDYLEAADKKVSLSQHYEDKFATPEGQPSVLEQMAASAGIRIRPDTKRGIPATSMKEIFHGSLDKHAGTTIRPSGADRQTTAGRILFPEIMMQMINETLTTDKEDYLAPWENAIALRTSVTGPKVDQPLINVTGPEGSAAQPIAQLAEPAVMVSITTGSRTYTIPTKSIGLQISDEAMQSATIDLVGLALAAQARGERIRRIEEDMGNIISGDTDLGITAVTFANASSFDAAMTTEQITHRAFVKWLRANYQKMSVTHILATEDTALDLESTFETVGTPRTTLFPVNLAASNNGMPAPSILILPASILGADRLVGFDRRTALHEITNVSASYSAIEEFVLRKSRAMRFDYGTALFKLYDEAFTGITLGA